MVCPYYNLLKSETTQTTSKSTGPSWTSCQTAAAQAARPWGNQYATRQMLVKLLEVINNVTEEMVVEEEQGY